MLGKVVRIGRQAALAAGAVLRQNYLKPHRVTLKGVIDPVTETDYQAQEIILAIIRQAFPDHAFLAEEREREGGEIPKKVWRFAPPKSASMRVTRTPNFERQIPMLAVIKLFPLPPLPPPMVQMNFRSSF